MKNDFFLHHFGATDDFIKEGLSGWEEMFLECEIFKVL